MLNRKCVIAPLVRVRARRRGRARAAARLAAPSAGPDEATAAVAQRGRSPCWPVSRLAAHAIIAVRLPFRRRQMHRAAFLPITLPGKR